MRRIKRNIERVAAKKRVDRLQRIEDAAPVRDGKKTALYAVSCTWWTSLGTAATRGHGGLPCCPYCGSVLMQAELKAFIRNARQMEEHYGPRGLNALCDAHDAPCKRGWT